MAQTKNSTKNVSTGRGVAGGYFFSAPLTAELPTDIATALPEAYVNLGFISSDGWNIAEDVNTDTQSDVNGETIDTSRGDRTETMKATLVEVKKDALAEEYGHSNVTDENGLITVKHNNKERDHRRYVAELVLKNGRRWRSIIGDGQVTEVAELNINSSDLVGREITITCNACDDLDGDTMRDFIESTETGGTKTTGGDTAGA